MATLAEKIVTEARSWVGTRWVHQGRLKGKGVDCAGLISEVARDAGMKNVDIPSNYQPHEDGRVMMKLLVANMDYVATEDRQPGDVVALCDEALRDFDIPRHLAIITDVTPTTTFIIHSSEHGVVEHRIDGLWLKRIHSCWRAKE